MSALHAEPRRCADCTMRSHGILADVPQDVFERISCCMTPHRFPARHRILVEGNPGRDVAAIRRGLVKLSRQSAGGRVQVLGVVGVGAFLGHEALVDRPYRTTAETLGDAEVCMASRNELLEQLREFPDVALGVAGFLCHRIESLETLVLHLGTLPALQRVAGHLLTLARALPSPTAATPESTGRPLTLLLPLTRQEIADALGMARETLSRQLSRLADDGLIHVAGGRIHVLDAAGLEMLAADAI